MESEGERRVLRFEAPTQDEAVANGKAAMAEATPTADAWAFAREGSWRRASDGARRPRTGGPGRVTR